MKSPCSPASSNPELRAYAEAELAHSMAEMATERSVEELMREFRVHQIELRMQNEALRQAQVVLEESNARYLDLFEFAPLGYLTFGDGGLISEINLTAVRMLGSERSKILGHRLDHFVAVSDRDRWRRELANALVRDGASAFDLILEDSGGARSVVHLNCLRVASGDGARSLRVALTDVTASRQAEVALRESEERFRQLFEVGNDAVFLVDCADGRFLEANGAAEKMYGYSRAEFLALSADQVFSERAGEIGVPHAGEPAIQTRYHRRRDGSLFPVEISGSHFSMDGRRVLVEAIRDISDRHRAEQTLRESNAFIRAILDSVSAEIAVLDRAGVIVAVNQSWRQFALDNGVEPGKPAPNTQVGSNYLAFCGPAGSGEPAGQQSAALDACGGIQAVLEGRMPAFSLEYPCHSPKERRWFSMCVTPLGPDRRGVVVAHTDITDRKRIEEELQHSEERYRTLVEGSPEAIFVHCDGRLLYANPTAVKMFGALSPQDLIGRSLLDLVHPSFRRIVLERLRNARLRQRAGGGESAGVPQMIEEKFVKLDGTAIDVAVRGSLITYNGKPAMHSSMRDITERKRTENELTTLRAEMEKLLVWQVARHTAAALAHEVNQPLSSISALCEAARRLLVAPTTSVNAALRPQRLGEILQRLVIESERAGGVVRHLLESLHAPDAKLECLPLPTVVNEAVHAARASGLADCQVVVDCASDLPSVRINRQQVEKVFLNLIGNSAEAMHQAGKARGRIWVSARIADDRSRACVTIRDEGPGVSKEVEKQIFHPFISTRPGNLGMGLAISRTLIEAQGGKLWHEPQDGWGATFHFTLPFAT